MSNTFGKVSAIFTVGGLFVCMGGDKLIAKILNRFKPPAEPTRPVVSLAENPEYQASKARWNRALEKQKRMNAAAGGKGQPGVTRGPGG